MLEINNTNWSSIDSLVEWKQLRKETLNLKIWQQKLPKLKSKGGGGGGGGGGKEKKKKKTGKKKEYSRNLVVNLAFLLFLSAFLKDIHHILWAIKYILCVYKPVTLSK